MKYILLVLFGEIMRLNVAGHPSDVFKLLARHIDSPSESFEPPFASSLQVFLVRCDVLKINW